MQQPAEFSKYGGRYAKIKDLQLSYLTLS